MSLIDPNERNVTEQVQPITDTKRKVSDTKRKVSIQEFGLNGDSVGYDLHSRRKISQVIRCTNRIKLL